MNPIQVSLTDLQKKHLEGQVQSGAFSDANQYIQTLIDKDRTESERCELEQTLLQRLDSPPIEMTEEIKSDLHQRCRDSLNKTSK
ncbi:MAG: hypothetical protein P9L94_06475 [Candidatus Hinthialibacter antarcticus]|nr:hypothetical protein [Candidatus Hinthialibacter antarcticus]